MTVQEAQAIRARDAEIAEKVFGCKVIWTPYCHAPERAWASCGCGPDRYQPVHNWPYEGGEDELDSFSEDDRAAWRVVEHLKAQGCSVTITVVPLSPVQCEVLVGAGGDEYCFYGSAKKMPEAVAQAALQVAELKERVNG